jgi:hypothetical protein
MAKPRAIHGEGDPERWWRRFQLTATLIRIAVEIADIIDRGTWPW